MRIVGQISNREEAEVIQAIMKHHTIAQRAKELGRNSLREVI